MQKLFKGGKNSREETIRGKYITEYHFQAFYFLKSYTFFVAYSQNMNISLENVYFYVEI